MFSKYLKPNNRLYPVPTLTKRSNESELLWESLVRNIQNGGEYGHLAQDGPGRWDGASRKLGGPKSDWYNILDWYDIDLFNVLTDIKSAASVP